ncbi:TrbI/VirB10 family protein [Vibrio ordalii]|uniref:TrbI/VirB10 family protein n=1 Tax=Vibrio ordalii TaxID=28174 RepID=UPI00024835CA|nr:TrbI/VirB10 family protein [Vibrio ordalii]
MTAIAQLQKGNLTPAVSYWKIFFIFFVVAFLAVLCVVGFMHYQSLQTTKEDSDAIEVASSHLPESYYPRFNRKEIEEKRALPDEKNGVSLNFVNSSGITPANEIKPHQANNGADETKAKTDTDPVIELTDEEILVKAKLTLIRELQEERRVRLLARRGNKPDGWHVVESIPTLESKGKKELKSPTDKNFLSQDIAQDMSTFPVDLSRVVTADRSIPCILIDQINSQLEGSVTCTVERNVFGFHGRNILIPAGTKIMGSHGTLKKVGDERFNITWSRLLRPDGAHVKLTEAYAADAIGGTGVEGHVNRRNWEKYGGAILTSTVSVLAQMSIPSEGTNISNSVFESFSTDLGRVTAAMLNENINIKPYSVVPAGTRILVKPTTDIWLKQEGQQLSFNAVEESPIN